jgi:hypothetical protein
MEKAHRNRASQWPRFPVESKSKNNPRVCIKHTIKCMSIIQDSLISYTEVSVLASLVRGASYSLLAKLGSIRKPCLTPEEVEKFNKSRGYDRLKRERGKL